jgi:hypothetical protein
MIFIHHYVAHYGYTYRKKIQGFRVYFVIDMNFLKNQLKNSKNKVEKLSVNGKPNSIIIDLAFRH